MNDVLKRFVKKVYTKNYVIIFLFTLFFLSLLGYGFKVIKKEIVFLTEERQERLVVEIRSKIFNWINAAKDKLEESASFIAYSSLLKNEYDILLFLSQIKKEYQFFDVVQLMLEDATIFFSQDSSYKMSDFNLNMNNIYWYLEIKNQLKTTVSIINEHKILKEKTMNICSPAIKNDDFKGILCGVLRTSSMIEKIKTLSFPEDVYFFIIIGDDQVAIEHKHEKQIEDEIINKIKDDFLKQNKQIKKYEYQDDFIMVSNIGIFDWSVGVGIKKENITKSTDVLFLQSILIVSGFLILVIFANFTHEFFYYKLNRKLKRAQTLMSLWLKDSSRGFIILEKGENITYINAKAKEFLEKIDHSSAENIKKIRDIFEKKIDTKILMNIDKYYFELSCEILHFDNQAHGLVVVIKDVTSETHLDIAKKEYEYILMHQGKMVEIAELIVGINHQLKQPINALSILMGNMLQEFGNDFFNKESFVQNIKLCQKALQTMDSTIDLYKKYSKNTFEIDKFYIKDSILMIKEILSIKIKRNNILLDIQVEDELFAISVENIFCQIVLVLLQNAIDATINLENKNIKIFAISRENNVCIEIHDYGCGVEEDFVDNLLKIPFKTSKKDGTGFGLYFANKLAIRYLEGEIKLKQRSGPTIFVLKFSRILQDCDFEIIL